MGVADWDWTGDDNRPVWERVLVGLRDGAFLGPEAGVRKRGLVSVNVGWLARGGLLRLHADRLEFEPNPLERLLGARRRTFPFTAIDWVERRPARAGDVLPAGEARRMRLHMGDGSRIDILPVGDTLDAWLVAIRESRAWWLRSRAQEPEGASA